MWNCRTGMPKITNRDHIHLCCLAICIRSMFFFLHRIYAMFTGIDTFSEAVILIVHI